VWLARLSRDGSQDGVSSSAWLVIHPKWRTPAFSLIGQGIWRVLTWSGRYDQLYTYVIFGMVLSYTLTVIGLFILPRKRPDVPRPYRCTDTRGCPFLRPGWKWRDVEYHRHPSHPGVLGRYDCFDRLPGYLYWKRKSRTGEESA